MCIILMLHVSAIQGHLQATLMWGVLMTYAYDLKVLRNTWFEERHEAIHAQGYGA
jgi:hypothetical protein